MGEQTKRSDRLVLVPCAYQGHITPMLQLGKALHSKGFSITIAHSLYNSPNPQSHPDFDFIPLPDGSLEMDHTPELTHVFATILKINENCKELFKSWLERVISEGEILRGVISDEFMFFAEDVANDLRLPSMIFRTFSAAACFACLGVLKLSEQDRLLPQGFLLHELVPELNPLRCKDIPVAFKHVFIMFSEMLHKLYGKKTSLASASIWNTVNCLEKSILDKIQQQCQVPIFSLGPLHKISPSYSTSLISQDKSCLSWLDKKPLTSVIYVSMGSIASLSEAELSEVAWGLANSQQPFLWVVRPGSIHGSDWIELLPQGFLDEVGDRGCVVKWAPQQEVLAHSSVGGFWSHCGWNSTLESISEGVPMLCKPCFGDQAVNARYVSHVWRVGLELENLERGEIERAIRKLILHDEGNEMRGRAYEMKRQFEASTTKGGSSYESLNELVKLIKSL